LRVWLWTWSSIDSSQKGSNFNFGSVWSSFSYKSWSYDHISSTLGPCSSESFVALPTSISFVIKVT
jgi:hypothetical protein